MHSDRCEVFLLLRANPYPNNNYRSLQLRNSNLFIGTVPADWNDLPHFPVVRYKTVRQILNKSKQHIFLATSLEIFKNSESALSVPTDVDTLRFFIFSAIP